MIRFEHCTHHIWYVLVSIICSTITCVYPLVILIVLNWYPAVYNFSSDLIQPPLQFISDHVDHKPKSTLHDRKLWCKEIKKLLCCTTLQRIGFGPFLRSLDGRRRRPPSEGILTWLHKAWGEGRARKGTWHPVLVVAYVSLGIYISIIFSKNIVIVHRFKLFCGVRTMSFWLGNVGEIWHWFHDAMEGWSFILVSL